MLEFKDQLRAFQTKLEATKSQLEGKLSERRALHDQRVALRNLEHIINALNKVERLLGLHEGSEEELELTGDLVERVASDVNYLNHCVSKCEAVAFVEEIRPRIDIIGDRLHNAMEFQFLNAVRNNEAEVLKRCLRIYASVDRVSAAEQLLRSRIIAPCLEDVICPATYHKRGLDGVCQMISNIIPNKLQLLLQLTGPQAASASGSKHQKKLSEFKFVLNALWPEVVEKFEQELPMIFSAGNPDQFHQHYLVMMDFIGNLEAAYMFGSGGKLHPPASPQPPPPPAKVLHNFVHRWNLPVYFQIRFQEIAGPVEEACQELFALEIGGGGNGKFHLKASRVIMEAVTRCWQPEVVLKPLAAKFWKLTLQIIARYAKAVAIASSEGNLQACQKLIQQPAAPVKSHMRSSSDTQIGKLQFYLICTYLKVSQRFHCRNAKV